MSALLTIDRPETTDLLARARLSLELHAHVLELERRRLAADLDRLRSGARTTDGDRSVRTIVAGALKLALTRP
ncbi:MAG TPA: hypothetical protein VF230_19260 [Acidimicrobiales bacterium]